MLNYNIGAVNLSKNNDFMTLLQNNSLELDVFYKKKTLPTLRVGDKVNVTIYLELPIIAEEGEKQTKERIQNFEGVVIAKHLSNTKIDATITVRKMFQGGGTEKVFLLNSPWVKDIKVLRQARVRRSKLYYLRERTGKSTRLKSL